MDESVRKWALSYSGGEIITGVAFKSVEHSIRIPNSVLTCTADMPEMFFISAVCGVRLLGWEKAFLCLCLWDAPGN